MPILYTAAAYDGIGGNLLDSESVEFTIAWGECEVWLVDIARPTNSLLTTIESMVELAFPNAAGVHRVLNRRDPIVTALVGWTPTSELVFLTETQFERDQARAILGSGYPFLLRTTPELGIGNMYLGLHRLRRGALPDARGRAGAQVPGQLRPGRPPRPGPVRARRPQHLRQREGHVRDLRRR